ncbi:MAG: NADH-quinone oxidoreductase subunit L [Chloroflexota bacterium]|nr:MAG: NADH-quinone oxidoreductase subunit L [Chloroflexota bacterium]
MQHFVWGVLLLPLVGFLAGSLGTRLNNRFISYLGPGSVFLAFLCAVVSFLWLQGQSEAGRQWNEVAWHWTLTGTFHLDFGLWLDPLSSTMSLIVTGVGFLILVYSIGYMHGDNGYRRFFSQMDLFIFTMLLLVLANNYLWLLVGWAGVGLTSYLLIGFFLDRPSAVAAARKAFVMNVIGDWGLMIALFMMFILLGGVDFQTVFSRAQTLAYNGQVVNVLGFMLLLAAVAKSAQLPLYTWLPDAMEGPTPVSALIHAATMVTAGVYLVARSFPIYQQAPISLHTVAFIGAVGTVYAATMGLANNDIKRILAYSTMSQIAYMFVGVGVAVYSAGMFHLLEHAFFKALLFMCAGSVMHALKDELNIQRMGGLRHKLPFTHAAFVVGWLAIMGIPPFSGFFSKEDIIGAAYSRALHGDGSLWIVWILVVLAAGLTAAYMTRLYFLVFHGEPRDPELFANAHEPALSMRVPMMALMVLSLVGGFLAFPGGWNEMGAWLRPVFDRAAFAGLHPVPGAQPFELASLVLTLAITIAGFLAAFQIYYLRSPSADRVGAAAPALYSLLYHRYYVDELYDLVIVRPIKLTAMLVNAYFERYVVDGAVNGAGIATRFSGSWLRRVQTGYARNYALSILLGAVALVGYYIIGGR